MVWIVLGLTGLPAGADDWWRDDRTNPWNGTGQADAPWGNSGGEAWWIEPGENGDPWGTLNRQRNEPPASHPWSGKPMRSEREEKRRTYDPWSDWTDRPWADTGSRSRRDAESRGKKKYREETGPRPPYGTGSGPYPAYPQPFGYAPLPWGGYPW